MRLHDIKIALQPLRIEQRRKFGNQNGTKVQKDDRSHEKKRLLNLGLKSTSWRESFSLRKLLKDWVPKPELVATDESSGNVNIHFIFSFHFPPLFGLRIGWANVKQFLVLKVSFLGHDV